MGGNDGDIRSKSTKRHEASLFAYDNYLCLILDFSHDEGVVELVTGQEEETCNLLLPLFR